MTSTLPPVSIGLPFYNAERFLIDAIKSVFAQTHQDWELILMDDGSTDRSLEIARSIDDPRVRVYSDGQNKKLAARLNEINSLAQHDLIARMDADDLMATNRIEKQLRFLVLNPGYDLVTTGICSVTDDLTPYGVRCVPSNHSVAPYNVLRGKHGIVHATVIGRKDWFLRNPYDPRDHRGQDYRLWVRSVIRGDLNIGFLREPLYYYREEGSMTPEKMLTGQKQRREIFRANAVPMVGFLRSGALFSSSYAKSAVIMCASIFGATDRIVRNRSGETSGELLGEVSRDVSRINSISLPTDGSLAYHGRLKFQVQHLAEGKVS